MAEPATKGSARAFSSILSSSPGQIESADRTEGEIIPMRLLLNGLEGSGQTTGDQYRGKDKNLFIIKQSINQTSNSKILPPT